MRIRIEDMSPVLKAWVEEALARQRVRTAQDGPQALGDAMMRTCAHRHTHGDISSPNPNPFP